MSTDAKIILAFTLGAAAGVAGTYKFFKTKYERIAQEEIDSYREVVALRNKKNEEKEQEEADNAVISQYEALTDMYKSEDEKGGSKTVKNRVPRVVSPKEFEDNDLDYEIINLDFYAGDETLVDDVGDVIVDWDNTVGDDFHLHFGDYEDDPDTVYVRNDELKCYYEICKDDGVFYGESQSVDR